MATDRDPFDDRGSNPLGGVTDFRPVLQNPRQLPDLMSEIVGICLDMLQTHFASASRIFLVPLRQLVWHPEISARKIVIEDWARWDPRQAGHMPSLVVQDGPAQSRRLGIFDEDMSAPPPGIHSGGPCDITHVRGWEGQLTIWAADKAPQRCRQLGAEVRQHFQCFSPLVANTFGFDFFEVVGIGGASKPELFKSVEGSKDLFGVPVTIGYTLTESWALLPDAPVISNIKQNATAT